MSYRKTGGSSPEGIARLLGISLDPDVNGADANTAEAAAQLLEAHLAISITPSMRNATAPGPSGQGSERLLLRSMGESLTDPHSDLDEIEGIKDRARRMIGGDASEAEKAVATTIYYASIASALVFHDQKLTTHSYRSLEKSFQGLAKKGWMPERLASLFADARAACQRKL